MNGLGKDKIAQAFGVFIRTARENKGLYQADIAGKIGVSRGYYAHIEGGTRDISLTLAVKICRVLDLNLNDFVEYSMQG